jgi:predicted ATPase
LLLRFVARELASSRTLLVVACRDVDPVPGRPLAAMLGEVAREPGTTRLSLQGLSEEAVADYVEAELASRELASTLYESTEGNPLFLGETVRLLALEGRVAIPPSLRDVIARRLAHLSDECNRVLVLAAVLGREFDHAALASMIEVSVDELLETLDEAMTARVVSDVPGASTRSRFAHVLIRDALYDSLTSARRVYLHRKAVDVLEDDAELAFHAMAGNDFETARVCAQRAGDRALALLAYEEAARLYDTALRANPDERARCVDRRHPGGDRAHRRSRTGGSSRALLARARSRTRARSRETFASRAGRRDPRSAERAFARPPAGPHGWRSDPQA